MLQVTPDLRLTAEDALRCDWMGLDAEALASKDLSKNQTQMGERSVPTYAANQEAKQALQALIKTNKWLSLGAMAGKQTADSNGEKVQIEEIAEDDFEDCYDWGKKIGIGTFSVIHSSVSRDSGDTFAVKRIPRADLWEEDAVALQSEISCLKLLTDCPYIVRLKEVFDEPDFTYMVLEQLVGGYLIDKIIEKENYDEPEGLIVAKRLISAVAYCHEQRIAIRDLKPESMLLVS
jgi:serine/threonine protein kinase